MRAMKAEILTLLRESENYISGQEMCERFGVTRAAVWKAVNRLKQEGYQIDAVQNRGYKLVASPDVFTADELNSLVRTKWAGRKIAFYETVSSTNVQAKLLAEEGAAEGTVVTTQTQTAGRGRRGRSWQSPYGANLYFTLILKPDFQPDYASALTLVMALAVSQAIEQVCGLRAEIKWPNDIVINGKKVTGILTEMSLQGQDIQHVVVGVGVNVLGQDFPKELKGKATCLMAELGKPVSRAVLFQRIMEHFEENYEMFLQTLDLSGLKDVYNNRLVNRDREVRVLDPLGEYTGFARGINERGELLVETAQGKVETVYAGEVSVRGIYGYV